MNDFLHHYVEIVSDPAHAAAEITFMLLIDVLVLGLLWPMVRKAIDRRIHAEHLAIDAEHGITHDPAYVGRHRASHAEVSAEPLTGELAALRAMFVDA